MDGYGLSWPEYLQGFLRGEVEEGFGDGDEGAAGIGGVTAVVVAER